MDGPKEVVASEKEQSLSHECKLGGPPIDVDHPFDQRQFGRHTP
jgi:hypothetical protein